MKVTIDPATLEDAVNEKLGEAIVEALGSYKVRDAVASSLSDSMVGGVIKESIDRAMEAIDTESLVSSLAVQIQRTTTAAVCTCISEGFIETILNLRGIADYDTEKRQLARAELLAEWRTPERGPVPREHTR